ncbi:MAG TPA: methylated-DNA--[protein]-cysteine S-methyltransferase [Candidatus Brachybacterium merdigallinarum]|nr:methylated-DNA--[protein]-cysteine S-methyltransferase [Candidatus Brachybacterium merdigallinarum]
MTTSTPSLAAPEPGRVHRRLETPLGSYLLAVERDALVGLWRQDQKKFPAPDRQGTEAPAPHPLLDRAARQLQEYLAGERTEFDLPLAPAGTAFQRAVWTHLATIPRGATTTYGQIARALERPRAAQAVGAAVGSNPLSIIVPCHRVVAGDGALTGYAGGLETKRALLALEGALPSGTGTA